MASVMGLSSLWKLSWVRNSLWTIINFDIINVNENSVCGKDGTKYGTDCINYFNRYNMGCYKGSKS
ncbi:hypothetical protein HMPREF9467_00822 [ [[Clostridium] clostridioforme 2_1_49FAA]|nr:hypothetical protein HMPREF9467_00822 [ [[Clostridium] clostridioforme 2_1_49FAA]